MELWIATIFETMKIYKMEMICINCDHFISNVALKKKKRLLNDKMPWKEKIFRENKKWKNGILNNHLGKDDKIGENSVSEIVQMITWCLIMEHAQGV